MCCSPASCLLLMYVNLLFLPALRTISLVLLPTPSPFFLFASEMTETSHFLLKSSTTDQAGVRSTPHIPQPNGGSQFGKLSTDHNGLRSYLSGHMILAEDSTHLFVSPDWSVHADTRNVISVKFKMGMSIILLHRLKFIQIILHECKETCESINFTPEAHQSLSESRRMYFLTWGSGLSV